MIANRLAFTICAKNRLPSAIVCRDSFKAHNPDIDFIIVLADRISEYEDIELLRKAEPLVNCYQLKELAAFRHTNKLEEMAFKYDVTEFCTSIKPFCITDFMWSGYDQILFFDPDIEFYKSIEPCWSLLDRFDCILTPHILTPMPNDDKHQNDMEILACGIYNLGFGGWSLSQNTLDFLNWWQQKLKDYCFKDVHHHMFVDQYWMGFAPAFLNTYIIKDPGYNVAYWNLHERKLKFNKKWIVNDIYDLVFYHFSGLDYLYPHGISKYQDRFTMYDRPELSKLIPDYLSDLSKYEAIPNLNKKYYFDNNFCDQERRATYPYVFRKEKNPWLNTGDCGLHIIGYFDATNSIGEVVRSFIQKLYNSSVPYTCQNVPTTIDSKENGKEFELYYTDHSKYAYDLIFMNLDQIHLAPKTNGKKALGVCWWETLGPINGIDHIDRVDEFIVFTKFTENIFKRIGKPVHLLPYPVLIPKQGSYISARTLVKEQLGLSGDDFVFYNSFDYASSFERKNPLAIIQAFTQFRGQDNIKLLFKTLHAENHPVESNQLDIAIEAARLDKQVTFVDGPVSKHEYLSIMNMCDCYVSLHKSEGLGLNILDAMTLGKPVIASNYGGCTDFINDSNSLLVNGEMEVLQADVHKVYKQGSQWFNPDTVAAKRSMKEVFENEDLRDKISRQAREDMLSYSNITKFNLSIYDLLRKLYE